MLFYSNGENSKTVKAMLKAMYPDEFATCVMLADEDARASRGAVSRPKSAADDDTAVVEVRNRPH